MIGRLERQVDRTDKIMVDSGVATSFEKASSMRKIGLHVRKREIQPQLRDIQPEHRDIQLGFR